jgi:hypothetical protein
MGDIKGKMRGCMFPVVTLPNDPTEGTPLRDLNQASL